MHECSKFTAGPAKPKLVAKAAGTESSPWKIKRDAPKISAKDVPANLRSLMSCALWRLHESIDRNDANELFLLSDETAVQNVARKLHITVRTTKELGVLVAAKAKHPELDTFGDLEREFGSRSQSKQTNGKIPHPSNKNGNLMKDEAKANDLMSNEGTAKTEISHVIDEGEQKASEQRGVKSCNGIVGVGKNDVEHKSTERSQVEEPSVSLAKDGPPQLPSDECPPPSIGGSSLKASSANGEDHIKDQSQDVLRNAEDFTKALPSKAATPDGLRSRQTASNVATPTASSAAIQAPSSSTQAEHESEDSEEDVVVFIPQPKRSSVQKKPNQQSSRPSTPLTQPQQQKAIDRSPISQPALTPKPPSRGQNPTMISQSHPQPTAAPTVIDPDSYGRSLAVNPNTSPRTPRNPRSDHRPRHSLENSLSAQGPRGPRQAHSRTQSPRTSPTPSEAKGVTAGLQSNHVQRTSPPKQARTLDTVTTGPRGRGPNYANPSYANPNMQQPIQQKSLNTRMVESEEFVPRSAFKEAKLDPIGTPKATATTGATEAQHFIPKSSDTTAETKPMEPVDPVVSSDSFVPRSRVHVLPARHHTPKPRIDYITRNGASESPIHQRATEADINEPKASMPDVQYVLKSGSTRAATRGRGRLWIPS